MLDGSLPFEVIERWLLGTLGNKNEAHEAKRHRSSFSEPPRPTKRGMDVWTKRGLEPELAATGKG